MPETRILQTCSLYPDRNTRPIIKILLSAGAEKPYFHFGAPEDNSIVLFFHQFVLSLTRSNISVSPHDFACNSPYKTDQFPGHCRTALNRELPLVYQIPVPAAQSLLRFPCDLLHSFAGLGCLSLQMGGLACRQPIAPAALHQYSSDMIVAGFGYPPLLAFPTA